MLSIIVPTFTKRPRLIQKNIYTTNKLQTFIPSYNKNTKFLLGKIQNHNISTYKQDFVA